MPSTLLIESLWGKEPCSQLIPHLLPHLPAPGSTDPLLALSEQAAHPHIRVRKQAIAQAEAMLRHRDEQREAVLAILEYLARHDLMPGVREQAQRVLSPLSPAEPADRKPSSPPQDARHLFAVRCQYGHVSTFDKRTMCSERTQIRRGLDELLLPCPVCGVQMAVQLDCEGY